MNTIEKAKYDKIYCQKNADRIREDRKKYYKKNRIRILAVAKEYGRNHLAEGRKYRREYDKKNRDKVRALGLASYYRNHEQNKELNKNYNRQHYLVINGKHLRVEKRPYVSFCEVCLKEGLRVVYHHWDNNNFCKGVWVCLKCHWMVEILDKYGLIVAYKYLMLKKAVNKNERTKRQKKKQPKEGVSRKVIQGPKEFNLYE